MEANVCLVVAMAVFAGLFIILCDGVSRSLRDRYK